MNITPELLYNEVAHYCEEQGYITALHASFTDKESLVFNNKDIATQDLSLLDAVHSLMDKRRSMLFLQEIEREVKPDDSVIEAGVGTGLLSFMAAAMGASVTGIELNPEVLQMALELKTHLATKGYGFVEHINFVQGNAMKYIPTAKVDVIISENIYTALFYEKQVQIMNHLVQYLKTDGKAIPAGICNGVALASAQFPMEAKSYELFNVDNGVQSVNGVALTNDAVYARLHFAAPNALQVDARVNIQAMNSGAANALLLWSEVLLNNQQKIGRTDTAFLNGDILLKLPTPQVLLHNNKLTLHIRYRYGCKPNEVEVAFED